jgi:hypothetical protein
LPLLELVDRALDLAAAASIRKQRAIVRAIVLAERPREDLDAIDRCLDAVRDRRKLRAFTDKRLGAERAKRRRAADKAAVDVATGSTAARERPAEQIAQLQSRAWALRYRAERADRVWLERYDSLPTDTNPAPQPRAGAAELDAALDIRGRVNPAAAMRRAERRRRLDAGMDVAEADARELVEWDGLGLNRLSLAEPVTPEPLVEVHPARPSDGIGDRLRALKQQRALAQEAA